jgi:hypothetical protein
MDPTDTSGILAPFAVGNDNNKKKNLFISGNELTATKHKQGML